MRVATFNVHEWSDKKAKATTEATIEMLRGLACDAVVLQEVPELSGTLLQVAAALGMHHAFAPASFLGNALLSLAKPLAFEVATISSGLGEVRSAFFATLPWEGGTFTLAGTHLDHLYERNRTRQMDKLLAGLQAFGSAGLTLVAGDLNSLRIPDYDAAAFERIRAHREKNEREAPMGDVVARLEGAGWIDLWRLARESGPERLQGVFPDSASYGEIGTCWAGTRVDYLWAASSFGEHARLVGCERVPTAVSDHVPVVAEIVP